MLNSTKQNQDKEVSWIFLIPLIAAIVFVPLIVKIKFYDPKLAEYSWFDNRTEVMDVFQYWKSVWLCILGGIMLCMTLFLIFNDKKLRVKKLFIPLGVYALMCIISTIFSVSRYHSFHGFFDMFESIYCLLSYCLICYFAYAVIRSEHNLKTAVIWVLIGVLLVGIIGTSQYFSHDIIMSDIGRDFMLPEEYGLEHGVSNEKLALQFGEGRVYGTMYNPNYVGVYTAMILPLLLVLTITVDKFKKLLIYIPLIILMMFCLVGSLSRAGMIAIIGSFVLFLIMFHTIIVKYWKQAIGIFVILVIGVVVFDFARDHVISNRFMSIFNDDSIEEVNPLLTSIDLQDDQYILVYNGEEITFQNYSDKENNEIYPIAWDKEGNQLEFTVQVMGEGEEAISYYIVDQEGYEGLFIRPVYTVDEELGLYFTIDGFNYLIYYSETDKTYYCQNPYGKSTKIIDSETADWKIFKMFGGFSGRGYIWSKTIPLLKNYLFIGSGPDTYTFVYPHADYVDENYGGYGSMLISKPHCMYLQTGIQTGVISLLAWLIFYLWYFVDCFRLYFRKEYTTFPEKLGVGLMIATASYMISGIANDSNPSVAPIYWGLLGIGIATNTIVKNTREEEEKKKLRKEQAIAQAKAKVQQEKKEETNSVAL